MFVAVLAFDLVWTFLNSLLSSIIGKGDEIRDTKTLNLLLAQNSYFSEEEKRRPEIRLHFAGYDFLCYWFKKIIDKFRN